MEIHLGRIEQRLVGNKCPACGKTAEGGTSIDDQEAARNPKPGDYGVCLYCGGLNRYDERLQLCKVERRERRQLARDPRLKELLAIALRAARLRRQEWQ